VCAAGRLTTRKVGLQGWRTRPLGQCQSLTCGCVSQVGSIRWLLGTLLHVARARRGCRLLLAQHRPGVQVSADVCLQHVCARMTGLLSEARLVTEAGTVISGAAESDLTGSQSHAVCASTLTNQHSRLSRLSLYCIALSRPHSKKLRGISLLSSHSCLPAVLVS
jgi:hypothetical protein